MPASTAENAVTRATQIASAEARGRTAPRGATRQTEGPVEIVQVLNPYRGQPHLEESAARSRAGMLAAWLREGGERADLPPLPGAEMERHEARAPTLDAPLETPVDAILQAPSDVAPSQIASLEARQLAVRLLLLSGEIVEQVFGPARRWAVLDAHGETLETPAEDHVDALIEAGWLALSHFERGAAVWRLQPAAMEGRAAYCEKRSPAAED